VKIVKAGTCAEKVDILEGRDGEKEWAMGHGRWAIFGEYFLAEKPANIGFFLQISGLCGFIFRFNNFAKMLSGFYVV
jgi:hypothetical protein